MCHVVPVTRPRVPTSLDFAKDPLQEYSHVISPFRDGRTAAKQLPTARLCPSGRDLRPLRHMDIARIRQTWARLSQISLASVKRVDQVQVCWFRVEWSAQKLAEPEP